MKRANLLFEFEYLVFERSGNPDFVNLTISHVGRILALMKNRNRIGLTLLCLLLGAGTACAQSRSAGGTIGNDQKSLSGSREAKPDHHRAATQSGSFENIAVSSHCPITGATGIGRGPTFGSAKTAAIGACVAKGGIPSCCSKYTQRM